MRITFVKTLYEEAKRNKNIVLITGDLGFQLFDDFQNAYPGLEVICQSMVNLLVNGCATIENPVFSVFSTDPRAMDFLKLLKKHTTDVQAMEILLDEIDRGHQSLKVHLEFP